jgi:hypothetical protein
MMDRRKFIQTSSLATAGLVFSPFWGSFSCAASDMDSYLLKNFVLPPPDVHPGGYWWWLNGLVDK